LREDIRCSQCFLYGKQRKLCAFNRDDGQGLPKGFQLEQSKSLGLKIIRTVVESDLKGTFTLEDKFSGGTLATVKIPKNI
jgi:two-component sensor histidine kinase